VADLSEYRFTKTHEWVHLEGGVATIGISEHAQSELGDVIFVELPAVGDVLTVGQKFGTIESVKAASDLYTPVGGTVTAVNDQLSDSPERVNADPYGEGWMVRLKDVDEGGGELLDEAAYGAMIGG
jgi:glycine cleavage system H protein